VWCTFAAMLSICIASEDLLQAEKPIVVGRHGLGYTFGIQHNQATLILATSPTKDRTASIIRTSSDAPNTKNSEVFLGKNKGHITSGCILNVGGTNYLFAGLSVSGLGPNRH